MKLKYIYYFLVIACVAVFTSCSTIKKLAKPDQSDRLTGTDYIQHVASVSPQWQTLSAKGSLTFQLGNGKSKKVNASLRIARNRMIQISIVPLLGIEVARIELTPDKVLLVDRINKNYIEATFHELSAWTKSSLDFHILQSLLLNEIFVPGEADLTTSALRKLSVFTDGGNPILYTKGRGVLTCQFHTGATDGMLHATDVILKGTPYQINWTYSDFSSVSSSYFPLVMQITTAGFPQKAFLQLHLSRISVDKDWRDTPTTLPSRYNKVTINDILQLLHR